MPDKNMNNLKENGYKFVSYAGNGQVIFEELETGNKELFFSNNHCSSWHLHYNNTDWEFVRILPDLS